MAHDWLPYFLTGYFAVPVLHLVNMADVNAPTTAEIARVSRDHPSRVAVMSQSQAARLTGVESPVVVGFGLDIETYPFDPRPAGSLAWAGRISPEKGLEDSLEIARRLGETLAVAGAVEDPSYWRGLRQRYGQTIDYRGFLTAEPLRRFYAGARGLLQTQKWHEAFGIVTAEAMACGTPVVAYARGANVELVEDGVSGALVPPDDIDAAVAAAKTVGRLDRAACRRYAERRFSLTAYADRIEAWLDRALGRG
jgi:UDP-glucose:tetrahydrobiopterin glucosyltransferase